MGRIKVNADEIVSAYVNDGMSVRDIADNLCVTPATVIGYLKKAGVFEKFKNVEQWNRGRNALNIDAEQLANDYLTGRYTYQDLANKYDCSIGTVKNWLLKSGLVNKEDLPGLGGGMHRNDIDDEVLRKEYVVNRLTISQIARKYHLVGNTIKGRLIKLGLFVPQGSVAKW